jgi:hypothetical protein
MLKAYNERCNVVGLVLTMDDVEEGDETQFPITIEREERPKMFNIGTQLTEQ